MRDTILEILEELRPDVDEFHHMRLRKLLLYVKHILLLLVQVHSLAKSLAKKRMN